MSTLEKLTICKFSSTKDLRRPTEVNKSISPPESIPTCQMDTLAHSARYLLTAVPSSAFVASVLSIGYGINIPRDDIYYGKLLHDALETLETIVVPGKYPVEVFTALQYLPSWMPGTGFKKDIDVVRENVLNARRELYDKGKSLLVSVRHDTWRSFPDRLRSRVGLRVRRGYHDRYDASASCSARGRRCCG